MRVCVGAICAAPGSPASLRGIGGFYKGRVRRKNKTQNLDVKIRENFGRRRPPALFQRLGRYLEPGG